MLKLMLYIKAKEDYEPLQYGEVVPHTQENEQKMMKKFDELEQVLRHFYLGKFLSKEVEGIYCELHSIIGENTVVIKNSSLKKRRPYKLSL